MSACPMSYNRSTPPSSPSSFRIQDTLPSSPTMKYISRQVTIPSIATTCATPSITDRPTSPFMRPMNLPSIATCSSPSSPNSKKTFAAFHCPASPTTARRRFGQISLTCPLSTTPSTTVATTATAMDNLSINNSNNREQPIAASSCPVAATAAGGTGDAAGKGPTRGGKRKLPKGCGLLDWIRLCRTKKGQMGAPNGEQRPITLEELAKHNTEDDAWTAIRGKVYNLTHYIRFHPGGKEELMKGAGIDCSILFDEVHNWVNVESTLKACVVGPLVASSPNTQRKNTTNIIKNAAKHRKESATLTVAKPIIIPDGVNKQAVSRKISTDHSSSSSEQQLHSADLPTHKNTMELRMDDETVTRKNSMAAIACEEPDGLRQVSPESPIRPLVGESPPKKASTASLEAAEGSSLRLHLPPSRIRRTSEPHPRFTWVQSEKAVILHVATNNVNIKTSDVVVDVKGKSMEAAIFMTEWVFELNIDLSHAIVSSQVAINCGRVEISLKKEVPHQQWEKVGEANERLLRRNKRDTKYHKTYVESIKAVTHDTNLYTLRLPAGSFLNVPTGHHLSVKALVNGSDVERSYTPVSSLEATRLRNGQSPAQEGEFIELLIKLYKDGKMSSFLSKLKEGDEVMVSDPEGTFDAQTRLTATSDILLIAAGSGFTPMVKILRDFTSTELVPRQRIISNSEASGEACESEQQALELPPAVPKPCDCGDGTDAGPTAAHPPKTAKLLFANKKERDVMYKEELEHLEEATAGRFSVTHILSNASEVWSGVKGRINETILKANLPVINPDNRHSALVCVCGPEPFTAAIGNILVDLEFPDECVQIFE